MTAPSTGPSTLRSSAFVLRILHGALIVSIGLYLVVLFVVTSEPRDPPPPTFDEMQTMFYALCVAAAGSLVALVVLRGKMMPPRERPEQLRDRVPDDEKLSPAAQAAMAKLFTASILTWALAESVAIYGLVLGFLLYDPWPLYPFAAVSVIVMLIYAPRRSLLEDVVRAAR